jgi:PHP family Zn ribbon phosphoesterase
VIPLKTFWIDLHVHTVLSPCGELEMGAPEIVVRARETGLDLIAVTDHNSCGNVQGIGDAARGGGPVVLAGLEVQTAEDIHVVTLFPGLGEARSFQEWLWKKMPPTPNNPDVFGVQVEIDGENNILREEEILLVQGAGYSVDEVVLEVGRRGGLSIMAHIDRPSFSYPAVLGPVPDDLPVDALELSWRLSPEEIESYRRAYPGRVFVRSSDAHRLADMGREHCCSMVLESPCFDEIALALRGKGGRRVRSWW